MSIVITDANIFIDLDYMKLIDDFFSLGFEIHTTSPVLMELTQELGLKLKRNELTVINIDEEISERMGKLKFSKAFSYTDTTILAIAYMNNYTLLTGEGLMRKWGEKNNVEVHGILYILDQFVLGGLRTSFAIADSLEKLQLYNLWLPRKECSTYIKKWRL